MRTPYALAALALTAVALVGCSTEQDMRAVDPIGHQPQSPTETGDQPTAAPTGIPAAKGAVETRGLLTVLDDGSGPQACTAVADSLPPQCSGIPLKGWDWGMQKGFEDVSGTKWGDYALSGTFDGTSLTVTEVVPQALFNPGPQPEEEVDLGTPCQEPEGGWQVIDPATTTAESMDATFQAASALPDLALAWMDQSINPAAKSPDPAEFEDKMNDPAQLIINVAVTGDTTAAEAKLRETWGGMLCVSQAQHSEQEMQEIQKELLTLPGFLGGGGMSKPDHTEVEVVFDDGSIQTWLDQEYGKGLVSVNSVLVPA